MIVPEYIIKLAELGSIQEAEFLHDFAYYSFLNFSTDVSQFSDLEVKAK